MKTNLFAQMVKNIVSSSIFETLEQLNNEHIAWTDENAFDLIDALNALQAGLYDSILKEFTCFDIGSDEIPVEWEPHFSLNNGILEVLYKQPLQGIKTARYYIEEVFDYVIISCNLYQEGIFENTDMANTGYDFTLVSKDYFI